ncbi:ATP-binding protein [Thalassomonas sp. M1454]|uniref:ATP-binding protein n=1 Tax=Thalassomonas sp. M1454 TaxID=2594477 RepID=UPI00117F8957|nr:ATP-binding protein [Thalassomonas sp. M1454]TRX57312.1 response regulator [Thalassomonas sp. M1454]
MRFCLAILCLTLSFANFSLASASSVESVISQAKNLSDKQQGIANLQTYLTEQKLTAREQVQLLQAIASLFADESSLKDAIATLKQAKEISITHDFKKSAAEISKLIGIYSYFKGEHQQALDAYQFSLNYYVDVDIPIKQAHLYNNIGLVYDSMGKPLFTLEVYEKASKIYHEHGSEEDQIDIRFNIAGLYLSLKGYRKSIEILEEVVLVRTKLKNYYGLAQAHNHLGLAYKNIGEYKLSEQYTLKALDYFTEHGHDSDAAIELNSLASLNNELSKPALAKRYAMRSIELSDAEGFEDLKAYGLAQLAKAHFQLGEIELASIAITESDLIGKSLNHDKILHQNLIVHTLIETSKLNTKQAFATLYKYQNEQNVLEGKNLSEAFLKLESQQLNQKISQLKQQTELLALQAEEEKTQQNFIVVITIFTLVIIFLFYRRNKARLYHEQLESKVKDRTKELEIVAQQLKIASKVKSQFLANMSHEIRTPLTSILGQSEAIVLGEVEADNLSEEVKIIHKNSQHLLQLVNDILDLSKIEAGKLELNPEMVKLGTITDELVNMFNYRAKQKGLKFTIQNQLDSPFYFYADSLRLTQVLINFCSNAIKFTEQGDVTLTISKRDDNLVFSVKDTGIGMNTKQVKQVFDCFTQADSSVNRRFGGTGLGLFLSSNIADLMKADIEVESSLGEGSTFSFILPLKSLNQLSSVDADECPDTFNTDNLTFTGKILIVDDHSDILRLIKHLLQKLGLNVIASNNAKDAVSLAVKEQPQVILLDIQMPEIGGVETLAMLREQGCNQPTYALTANAMAHEVKSYLAQGFAGYLQKPINRANFITMLKQHFEVIESEQLAKAKNNEGQVDFSDLITTFKSNLTQDKVKLETYINELDYQNLEIEVHKIAGAAGMFGFAELSKRAIELESLLKSKSYTSFDNASEKFIAEITAVVV